ncbi:MAG: diacylglycerol kinase family protein [Candidatus Komeilibacteria bacterium]
MYLYIYDSFLTAKKYQGLIFKIENRLVDLGIKGRVVRLNVLKNMAEVVSDGISQGVTTVVVVGDDLSFSKIINIIADKNIALGVIPIDKKSKIGKILGVPAGQAACDVLAQRIIKKVDLGRIGGYYFLDSASIINEPTTIKFGKFNISPRSQKNSVTFNNLGIMSGGGVTRSFDPTDGQLECVIASTDSLIKKTTDTTIMPFTDIEVVCSETGAFITVDQVAKTKPPARVSIAPNKLSVIVGSDRLF